MKHSDGDDGDDDDGDCNGRNVIVLGMKILKGKNDIYGVIRIDMMFELR